MFCLIVAFDCSVRLFSILNLKYFFLSTKPPCRVSALLIKIRTGYKSTNAPLSFKPIPSNRQTVPNSRVPPKRSNSSVGKNGQFTASSGGSTGSMAGMGTRSISVGTLNQAVSLLQSQLQDVIWKFACVCHLQSDSDAENANSRGGVARPTISSQNKVNGGSNGLFR